MRILHFVRERERERDSERVRERVKERERGCACLRRSEGERIVLNEVRWGPRKHFFAI